MTYRWKGKPDHRSRSEKSCKVRCHCGGHSAADIKKSKRHHGTKVKIERRRTRQFSQGKWTYILTEPEPVTTWTDSRGPTTTMVATYYAPVIKMVPRRKRSK